MILSDLNEKMESKVFMQKYRKNKKDFTRNRKLPFSELIKFQLSTTRHSLQKELTNYMEKLYPNQNMNINKSAYSQSRIKFKHGAFIELNQDVVDDCYNNQNYKKYHGKRILAVDGSTIQLPNSIELLSEFGYTENKSDIMAMAKASTCYDVLNEIIVNAELEKYKSSELTMAKKHWEFSKENDLFVYDRGYCALWFMLEHLNRNQNFVIRVPKKFAKKVNVFIDDKNKKDEMIEFNEKDLSSWVKNSFKDANVEFNPFEVRFVKVVLSTGEVEILATNLVDETINELKKIYFMRWGIEKNFDLLKNRLKLEDWTGLSCEAVKQDFFASVLMYNVGRDIIIEAEKELNRDSKRKVKLRVNRNLSFGFFKERFWEILSTKNAKEEELRMKLKELMKLEPIPEREKRNRERIFKKSNRKFNMNQKMAF